MNILRLFCLIVPVVHLFPILKGKEIWRTEWYTINKIDSIPPAYIIYAMRHDSIFKIVSIKDSTSLCNNLEVGKKYNLALRSWLSPHRGTLIHVDGIHISGYSVGFRNEAIVQDIFYSKKLSGLCYE